MRRRHPSTLQIGVNVKTALRNARSVTQLFSLLAPHDARLCDVGLLEQLETSTGSHVNQDGSYQKLVAACNHTIMNHALREFPTLRGRSTISDKGSSDNSDTACINNIRPEQTGFVSEKTLSTKDVNSMNKLFKNAIPKTKCKIRSTLVTLPDPPNGFFYLPSCVSVKRCVGCCSDELTECSPTATKLVKKQVSIHYLTGVICPEEAWTILSLLNNTQVNSKPIYRNTQVSPSVW
uniref:Platelet-derived growth factor (PDGF) family profile domain-containing protein n=1 Tax=Timema shepardi TaxID=629360 RepID=A0A7R9AZX8_TIMSH|nr:unnamed protein product [Timema shepardi]